jgi:stearoyl-CoA desaturase (Delta-9 desaturase)
MTTLKLNQTQTTPYISTNTQVNRAKHLSNACSLLLPIFLALALLALKPVSVTPSVLSLTLAAIFFTLSSIGLGIGFHRHFTHHAFKTSVPGKLVLGVLGTWSMQGPMIGWIADHRRHHRFADQQFDPHSPWADEHGVIENRWAGWFHAHVGWKFKTSASDEKRYAADLFNDPVAVLISKYYWPIAVFGLLLPGWLGYLCGGLDECICCLLWAGCARAFLLQQFEGVANSITHLFGSKVANSQNESRDNLWLTVALMGEGLHSYHHQNATVAVNEPSKFDAFGHMIMVCERLGLVWDLRKGKPATIASAPPSQADLSGAVTI